MPTFLINKSKLIFQYNNIAAHGVPLILALFLGAWSDKHGGARKGPLLVGLVGKIFYSFMVSINAWQTSWPLYTTLYTATLPSAATGADLAIFMACFSYVADITTTEVFQISAGNVPILIK
jgi:MFS transporter, PCFT/HCP family, solute carrier family 46, member 3